MIVSFSHANVFDTNNSEVSKHSHMPYFLLRDDGQPIPKLADVIDIGEVEIMESGVNWGQKIPVRRIYVKSPAVTPAVSTEYYKKGYETYEQGIPYLQRVYVDHCAEGKWPLNSAGEEVALRCIIYDLEIVEGIIKCCGIGTFNIYIKSNVNLQNEIFDIDFKIDDNIEVKQIFAENLNQEYELLETLVDELKSSHVIVGHNILGFDNHELLEKIRGHDKFRYYINQYTNVHNLFNRGRLTKVTELYPISFDTLLASRFLFKQFAEGQFGLKRLSRLLDIKVEDEKQFKHRCEELTKAGKPLDRVYERDFGGFGRWSNQNPLCLQYNKDDIYETWGVFKKLYKEIFMYMFLNGSPFQDVISNSNVKDADYAHLIRAYRKEISPPMLEPAKVVRILAHHFGKFNDNGELYEYELPSKKELFEYFRTHTCTNKCYEWMRKERKVSTTKDDDDGGDAVESIIEDDTVSDKLINKILRCVKYGSEMPEYVEFYPLVYDYLSIGGLGYEPEDAGVVNKPLHGVRKGDTAAQYPTILKAKNISVNTVRLARKGEKPDGWCCFRRVGDRADADDYGFKGVRGRKILDLFEWRDVTPEDRFIDRQDIYKNQVLIGYINRGVEGFMSKSLTGIMRVVAIYKKLPEWKQVYDKSLKPMRNARTHGVMLAEYATGMQYNIAGAAIPTYGQMISRQGIDYITSRGYKLVEADTDGFELVSNSDNPADFETLIHDIERYWQKEFNYPDISFDAELFEHKLFAAEKNYITINRGVVKLTGATFKASDKAKIAQDIMKELMLKVLPTSNTKDEFISKVLESSMGIIDARFKTLNSELLDDITLIESIQPPDTYDNEIYKARSKAIEELTSVKIIFPTKMELIVCKEPLPGLHPKSKNKSKPIEYMWPREIVEKGLGGGVDIDWLKNGIIAYIDSAFDLRKVSVGNRIKTLFSFGEEEGYDDSKPQPTNTSYIKKTYTVEHKIVSKDQKKLF